MGPREHRGEDVLVVAGDGDHLAGGRDDAAGTVEGEAVTPGLHVAHPVHEDDVSVRLERPGHGQDLTQAAQVGDVQPVRHHDQDLGPSQGGDPGHFREEEVVAHHGGEATGAGVDHHDLVARREVVVLLHREMDLLVGAHQAAVVEHSHRVVELVAHGGRLHHADHQHPPAAPGGGLEGGNRGPGHLFRRLGQEALAPLVVALQRDVAGQRHLGEDHQVGFVGVEVVDRLHRGGVGRHRPVVGPRLPGRHLGDDHRDVASGCGRRLRHGCSPGGGRRPGRSRRRWRPPPTGRRWR